MGPAIRPFAYRRDPWWDVDGRVARRRRRRRLVAWSLLVAIAVTLGGLAGETRAASGLSVGGASVGAPSALDGSGGRATISAR